MLFKHVPGLTPWPATLACNSTATVSNSSNTLIAQPLAGAPSGVICLKQPDELKPKA